MDKTYRTELHRVFLLKGLPEPLLKSSSHLQIYDNYLENTRLRLRKMRSPETRIWSYCLQQRFPLGGKKGIWKIAEIHLNEAEHFEFRSFEGYETRKNRYFLEVNRKNMEVDVFLGELDGLILAKVVFEDEKEFEEFEIPPFAVAETTENPFFYGENLVKNHFSDIQNELNRMNKANEIFIAIQGAEDE
ncbi:MAG TPA: hypothetical protein PKY59_12315 [Pyrinomonadaceae bacterium]|nr:hypothetical protein [Pyrinomonadaceae bacterium]